MRFSIVLVVFLLLFLHSTPVLAVSKKVQEREIKALEKRIKELQKKTQGTANAGASCPTLTQSLEKGAKDVSVETLQRFLASRYSVKQSDIVTGFFGDTTKKYVMQFQREQGIPAEGIVGPLTRVAITKACSKNTTQVAPRLKKDTTQKISGSIDRNSLETLLTQPRIEGTAKNVSVVTLSISTAAGKVYGSGNIAVVDGEWLHQIGTPFAPGVYSIELFGENTRLTKKKYTLESQDETARVIVATNPVVSPVVPVVVQTPAQAPVQNTPVAAPVVPATPPVVVVPPVTPTPPTPPVVVPVGAYYTQTVLAKGIVIKAAAKVDPQALVVAKTIVERMLATVQPALVARMVGYGAALAIVPRTDYVSVLPEYTRYADRTLGYIPFSTRGGGGVIGQPITATSEENLLKLPGDGFWNEDITYHEFGHAIMNLGFSPQEKSKWSALFTKAKARNTFPGTYAMTTQDEYFAEFSQSYFGVNNEIGGKTEMQNGDPEAYAFVDAIYTGTAVAADTHSDRLSQLANILIGLQAVLDALKTR